MTRILESLAEIAPQYDALFCDLWGCLHDGVRAFPDAVAALRDYRRRGGRVVLLTNSPRTAAHVARQLAQVGAPPDCWDEIATSGDSAQTAMIDRVVGQRVFHLGPERDAAFFTDLPPDTVREADGAEPRIMRVPLETAEGIVCTGLLDDETEGPEDYRRLLRGAVERGLRLLCANPDIEVDRGGKRIFCAGALARLYTELGGESLYFGKPHAPINALARRRLAALAPAADARILAIGDGPGTDVAGALAQGLDTLFVTGGLAAAATATRHQPDSGKLREFLAEHSLNPAYAIGQLR